MRIACGCNAPAPPGLLLIRRRADLQRLGGLIPSYRSVHVLLPDRSMQDNAALEMRITRDYLECGCAQGARALWVGSVVALVALMSLRTVHGNVSGKTLAAAIALVGTGSVVVKFAAVVRARWRLACTLRGLRSGPESHPIRGTNGIGRLR
jgi:hypothetical protein